MLSFPAGCSTCSWDISQTTGLRGGIASKPATWGRSFFWSTDSGEKMSRFVQHGFSFSRRWSYLLDVSASQCNGSHAECIPKYNDMMCCKHHCATSHCNKLLFANCLIGGAAKMIDSFPIFYFQRALCSLTGDSGRFWQGLTKYRRWICTREIIVMQEQGWRVWNWGTISIKMMQDDCFIL